MATGATYTTVDTERAGGAVTAVAAHRYRHSRRVSLRPRERTH
ncbi:Uncharacterised protein [Mycobacterium tuberculosis]|nr:Uncharacterised protein [Mycobacterium tuberculosis]